MCRARVAVRCEVRAVAGKRGLPRGRAPGFMCNEAADFLALNLIVQQPKEALDLELQVKEELVRQPPARAVLGANCLPHTHRRVVRVPCAQDIEEEAQLDDARILLDRCGCLRHVRLLICQVLVDASHQVDERLLSLRACCNRTDRRRMLLLLTLCTSLHHLCCKRLVHLREDGPHNRFG